MKTPIIIIGAARSGTKFLRDALAAGRGTTCVPYDVNYIWRYGAGSDTHDRLDPADLTEHRKSFIRNSLARIALQGPSQILIEKTVSNTLRVPFVDAVFPDARYIHLVRDGRDVTESAMRQWQNSPSWLALLRKLARMPFGSLDYAAWYVANTVAGLGKGRSGGKIWGPRYPGIERDAMERSLVEVCARQWRESVLTAQHDLAELPSNRVHNIRYEELVAGVETFGALLHDLSLTDRKAKIDQFCGQLQPENRKRWKLLSQDQFTTMMTVIEPTLEHLGYQV